MYKNENIELDLELYNKVYVPEEYVNQNYKYTLSGDNLTIITNQNCITQNTTTQCDCYILDLKYNVIKTQTNRCNYNPTSNVVPYTSISNNVDYSDRITSYYIKQYGIYFAIIVVALLFISTIKRNSRNI